MSDLIRSASQLNTVAELIHTVLRDLERIS